MRTFATILNNPGEPPAETHYRDANRLREIGYSDLIIYETTGISGLLEPSGLSSVDMRRWVKEQSENIDEKVQQADKAGLKVWLTIDAPSLIHELVGSAMTCVNQPHTLCPASSELLDMLGECLDSLFSRFNPIEGFVLRLGDTDAHRIPYMKGNDLYSPHCARCANLGRADRLVNWIDYYFKKVVEEHGRKLIVRAWNVRPGGMHDSEELCERVLQRVPKHDDLIFSFKFTKADFWRYQQWNPSSLKCADRPMIYELQCQREFEGKGAIPNYQPLIWRDGMPENDQPCGLSRVVEELNITGLWSWVRGGGWGGPYLTKKNEKWIDANVIAVPKLAQQITTPDSELVKTWLSQYVEEPEDHVLETVQRVLENSVQNIRQLFYIGPYAQQRQNEWYPSGSVIQDDSLDAEAAWTIIQQLPANMLDAVIHEKHQAELRLEEDIQAIRQISGKLGGIGDEMIRSLEYGITLVKTLHRLLSALVSFRRYRSTSDPVHRELVEKMCDECQHHWAYHQRVASHSNTATAYQSDNLYEVLQRLVDGMN